MTVAALIVALAALALALLSWVELVKLRRRVSVVPTDGGVFESLRQLDEGLRLVEDEMDDVRPRVDAIESRLPLALRHTGIVAYDAFDDIAGRQSRSIALLNDKGDGFVISLLVGRDETLFFTKQVRNQLGIEPLSPEEEGAIRQAMAG